MSHVLYFYRNAMHVLQKAQRHTNSNYMRQNVTLTLITHVTLTLIIFATLALQLSQHHICHPVTFL